MSASKQARSAGRLWGAVAALLGGGALIGVGCGNSGPLTATPAPRLEAQDDDIHRCMCYDGYYYTYQPISPSDTRCDLYHCGRDRIAYVCIDHGATGDNWQSFPQNHCGELACPAEGMVCGEDVINGEPAALYRCPGVGQIPLDWRICPAGCHNGACTGEPSSKCPCDHPPVPGGDHIPTHCGMTLCFPTGAGDGGVQEVCTDQGFRSTGLSCRQRQGSCGACSGVEDSFGNVVTTTTCGEKTCGLGIGNHSLWECGEKGWLDLNVPCQPIDPNDVAAELGRCPEEFQDNDGKWKPVEPGQTFCGDQVFGGAANEALARSLGEPEIRIRGDSSQLFACVAAGERPIPYRTCSALGGSGQCKRVQDFPPMRYHEITGRQPAAGEPPIRDWDRCDQSCTPAGQAYYQLVERGSNGANDCRHLFCGQHDTTTGRVGTLYYCAYDTWSSCPPSASSKSAVVGHPVPYEECATGCGLLDPKSRQDLCVAKSDQKPFGIASDDPGAPAKCDPILDYQGNPLPSSSLRKGSEVCGPGGQVFECTDRVLSDPDGQMTGLPDGWRKTGLSCGTSCGVCGPDPYGSEVPLCDFVTTWLNVTCNDATFNPDDIPCKNARDVLVNNPAYCGGNPSLGVKGDPAMLYLCKAYCPHGTGAQVTWAPCVGHEGDGQGGRPWSRRYRFDHSVYCPMGCQVKTGENDACNAPGGAAIQFPFQDHRMVQNLGHLATWAGGRHLGEDIVKSSGSTAGEYVYPIARGKLLWAGINCSQYLGVALVEHHFVENGQDKRFCSFYGHLDLDELATDLVGQDVTTTTALGKVVEWNQIPTKHNAARYQDGSRICPNDYNECPSSGGKFNCDANNSHLHYVVLSDAECRAFDANGSGGPQSAPLGYDQCTELSPIGATDTETAVESYTALSSDCSTALYRANGLISPEWFVSSPSH